ncbi:hypothetical protein FOA43_002971 [Brettanomyces nanus]|uniref:Uncharacterized protein n=1 Tax=Eeniella nana TaxID=13502 RepID=A0A875S959_EENNA|nr:uncharacterized protein FOA43_002971 [Brettanomyces nanus]QPG75614.1 hypothetical protein FOA43_002971 [Brettanomyces nanus]
MHLMNTLIVAFNDRLTRLLPLMDDYNVLYRYFQLYKIDVSSEQTLFLRILNRPEISVNVGRESTTRLRPLRLRSLNVGGLGRSTQEAIVPSVNSVPELNQLPPDSLTLFKQLRLIRKMYICCILTLLGTGKVRADDEEEEEVETSASFLNFLKGRFNVSEKYFKHVTRATRLFLCMKMMEHMAELVKILEGEVEEDEVINGVDNLDEVGEDYSIAEESENEDLSELVQLMDSLSYKLGILEQNSNTISVSKELKGLRSEFQRLYDLYEESSGDNWREGIKKRRSDEISDFRIGHKSDHRKSSGLSFGLLTVVDKENCNSDEEEIEGGRQEAKNKLYGMRDIH